MFTVGANPSFLLLPPLPLLLFPLPHLTRVRDTNGPREEQSCREEHEYSPEAVHDRQRLISSERDHGTIALHARTHIQTTPHHTHTTHKWQEKEKQVHKHELKILVQICGTHKNFKTHIKTLPTCFKYIKMCKPTSITIKGDGAHTCISIHTKVLPSI